MADLNIIFFGEDSFSAEVLQAILNDNHNILLVATPFYENALYRRLELISLKNNIPFCRVKDIHSVDFENTIKNYQPDLLITAHFQKLLRKELISIPKLGCINLHPSLLPLYRGMSPQHWPIIKGDVETGVTVHYIEEDIDTGNILVQKRIPISREIYVAELQKKMVPIYKEVIVKALSRIQEGYEGIKQDLSDGSYYGKFKNGSAEIGNSFTVIEAYNLIRAISKPYVGAYYHNVRIWKANILDAKEASTFISEIDCRGIHTFEGIIYLFLKDGILKIEKFEYI